MVLFLSSLYKLRSVIRLSDHRILNEIQQINHQLVGVKIHDQGSVFQNHTKCSLNNLLNIGSHRGCSIPRLKIFTDKPKGNRRIFFEIYLLFTSHSVIERNLFGADCARDPVLSSTFWWLFPFPTDSSLTSESILLPTRAPIASISLLIFCKRTTFLNSAFLLSTFADRSVGEGVILNKTISRGDALGQPNNIFKLQPFK